MSSAEGSSSSPPNESAFPDEDEDTMTMLDVIEREDKLEEEASAVLGNSDEKNCTYSKGYISRQAIYSCATCSDGSDKPAAICLACSLECHDNHDVYELYTKRNYRCDCGNSKFGPDFECKLMDKQIKKLPLNECNKYNHNFAGRYCICDKRYPPDVNDDSAESNDSMLQCIVCEDWYHTKHLGVDEVPAKFDELICGQCVEQLDFVRYYKELDAYKDDEIKTPTDDETPAVELKVQDSQTSEPTTVAAAGEDLDSVDDDNPKDTRSEVNSRAIPVKSENTDTVCESDTNDSQLENKDPDEQVDEQLASSSKSDCILEELKKNFETKLTISDALQVDSKTDDATSKSTGPIFWSDCQWRTKLCHCQRCLEMYKAKECEYLLDDQDTVQYYEAQGKAMAKDSQSPLERGMSALNRMNRVAVAEALHGYDELKADLSVYLRGFANSKKVVKEADIHEFFEQLKSKKRPRLDY